MTSAQRPTDASLDERSRARLAEISALESTVDLAQRESYVAASGWHLDAREIALPSEAPGEPEPRGTFVVASEILRAYAFTPKRLITGAFDSTAPLLARPMLLTARFLWVRFELGVRVSRVIDEQRVTDGVGEQVWGYSYHTLSGHVERGEITFEIIKVRDTGAIRFRIHSFSQTGHIPNWFYRFGFWLVGRRLQRRFAVQSLRNMRRLVISALEASASVH
ncbi:DUF1990 family protein [Gemmatimonas sp.]|uniref:DUF1990 family protein n=1 Tax=Gemmatimonas sp. TaxID=1962908 RepID=UPI0039836A29